MSATDWAEATDEVCGAALAGLPWCTPARLRALLGEHSPRHGLLRLLDERNDASIRKRLPADFPETLPREWRRVLKTSSPEALEERLGRAGVDIWLPNNPRYPAALAIDPERPEVLFARGDPAAVECRRVAIIGTRRATAYGRGVAKKLGADLTHAGVAVVSGLAIGIDGAAHEGVLGARGAPVGVVGSGLDVVYPRRHAQLWSRVGGEGLLLSEAGMGMAPEPWRFPQRNRIIAALAEVVVVVESGAAGGSQITVEAAMKRDVTVMAVPGPVTSASSAGTNRLLCDGVAPALNADDVLTALGLTTSRAATPQLFRPDDAELSSDAIAALNALDFSPTSTERLISESGLSPGRIALGLEELRTHQLASGGGGWWSRRK